MISFLDDCTLELTIRQICKSSRRLKSWLDVMGDKSRGTNRFKCVLASPCSGTSSCSSCWPWRPPTAPAPHQIQSQQCSISFCGTPPGSAIPAPRLTCLTRFSLQALPIHQCQCFRRAGNFISDPPAPFSGSYFPRPSHNDVMSRCYHTSHIP